MRQLGASKGAPLPVEGPCFGMGDRPAKTTRGSETSQYPEEEKSTEIPLVAASERGTA